MITITGYGDGTKAEHNCAFCQKDYKPGVFTTSEMFGAAFFCWACLKKLVAFRIGKKTEPETPLLDRIEDEKQPNGKR
jgi:hypothetical protein